MRVRWPASALILALLPALAAAQSRAAATPAADLPRGYERKSIRGFTVIAPHDVVVHARDQFGRTPLDVVELELSDMQRVVHPYIFRVMQKVPVWAEWDLPLARSGVVACYYPFNEDEMRQHNEDTRLAGSIQIVTVKRLGELRHPGASFQQIVLLHEM